MSRKNFSSHRVGTQPFYLATHSEIQKKNKKMGGGRHVTQSVVASVPLTSSVTDECKRELSTVFAPEVPVSLASSSSLTASSCSSIAASSSSAAVSGLSAASTSNSHVSDDSAAFPVPASDAAYVARSEVPSIPPSFVVCGCKLGYANTGYVILALYSVWASVIVAGAVKWFIAAPASVRDYMVSVLWFLFLYISLVFFQDAVAHSAYRRLTQSPQQFGICAATVAILVLLYALICLPHPVTLLCFFGVSVSLLSAASTHDVLGRHVKHLQLKRIEEDYARYVRDLCRRAVAAWKLENVTYSGELPPDPDAFRALRNSPTDCPIFELPPSFTGTLTLQLTPPLTRGTADPLRLVLDTQKSTLTCSISYLVTPAFRHALFCIVDAAKHCHAKLGLTALVVEKALTLPDLNAPSLLQAIRRAAQLGPAAPADPARLLRSARRYLTIRDDTAEANANVKLDDADTLQIHVRLGSRTLATTARKLLHEYVAYQQ